MADFSYSPVGIGLTKHFEGLRLQAYQDSAGVWTIGYGHTGPGVRRGMVIDAKQAEVLLLRDIAWAVACVNKAVTAPINQNQFDALVDFTFNVGCQSLTESTLLRYVNSHRYDAAAGEFMRWNMAGGVVSKGLTKRREAERALFATKPIDS